MVDACVLLVFSGFLMQLAQKSFAFLKDSKFLHEFLVYVQKINNLSCVTIIGNQELPFLIEQKEPLDPLKSV